MPDKILKDIEERVLKNDGVESFYTWGNKERTEIYHLLTIEYLNKGINYFKTDTNEFFIYERPSTTAQGRMDGSPHTVYVCLIKK